MAKKGLNSLLPEQIENEKQIVNIKISDIYPNNTQPRKSFDEDKIISPKTCIAIFQNLAELLQTKKNITIYINKYIRKKWN